MNIGNGGTGGNRRRGCGLVGRPFAVRDPCLSRLEPRRLEEEREAMDEASEPDRSAKADRVSRWCAEALRTVEAQEKGLLYELLGEVRRDSRGDKVKAVVDCMEATRVLMVWDLIMFFFVGALTMSEPKTTEAIDLRSRFPGLSSSSGSGSA